MKRNWKFQTRMESDADDSSKIITLERPSDATPQGNSIYFYGDVTKESVLNLTRQIDELTKQLKMIQFAFNLSEPPHIEIHICSDGGDMLAGLAAVDKIINNPIPIDTYCEGMVASAATLISSVGNRRYIGKNSFIMIHQLSSDFWGNYSQCKDEMQNLELLMNIAKKIYLKHTKFEPSKLDEILTHDLLLDAEKCVVFGVVDEIL